MPPALSFIEAATLPCAALTAWNSIHTTYPTGSEDVVITRGHRWRVAVRSAIRCGCRSYGARHLFDRGEADASALFRVAHLINYRSDAEWGKTARNLTNGRGVDLVVEVGGAGTIKQSIRAVRMGGTIALVGMVSGAAQELNLPLIAMNSLRMIGVTVGSRAQFTKMLSAIERHKIKPVVDHIFPLTELGKALAWLKNGKHVGKVCVEID